MSANKQGEQACYCCLGLGRLSMCCCCWQATICPGSGTLNCEAARTWLGREAKILEVFGVDLRLTRRPPRRAVGAVAQVMAAILKLEDGLSQKKSRKGVLARWFLWTDSAHQAYPVESFQIALGD